MEISKETIDGLRSGTENIYVECKVVPEIESKRVSHIWFDFNIFDENGEKITIGSVSGCLFISSVVEEDQHGFNSIFWDLDNITADLGLVASALINHRGFEDELRHLILDEFYVHDKNFDSIELKMKFIEKIEEITHFFDFETFSLMIEAICKEKNDFQLYFSRLREEGFYVINNDIRKNTNTVLAKSIWDIE